MNLQNFHRIKAVGYFLVIVYLCLHIVLVVWVQTNAYLDNSRPSDVAIVLGTSPNQGGPNPCLVSRISHAVDLYSKHEVKKIILSGGKLANDDKSEAEIMQDLAMNARIPESDLILEKQSTSTWENLVYSQRIMKENNFKTAIIVSDPHQLPRASLVAKTLHLDTTVSPAVGSPCSTQRHNMLIYWFYEPLKLIGYKLTGRI